MNKDVISDRIKKQRAAFMSTFYDAPPEAKLEMILKLCWNNAVDTAKVFFGSIDANVPVGVHRKFVQSEQQLAMEKMIGAARDEVNHRRWPRMHFCAEPHGYFVVTGGLREKLLASAPARIVNTASAAHQGAKLDFDDLQLAKSFGPMTAYGRSKLCNILFTRELARQLQGTGVTANCLHPGFAATRIGDESGGLISRFAWLAKLFAISPERGADTIVYLASSPAVAEARGKYFYKRHPIAPSPAAQDDRAAALLWERSAALAGLKARGAFETPPHAVRLIG
jgi:NAD(P)-dependent dehydrogenase (short-subunit alcohol dehydrogenase family)